MSARGWFFSREKWRVPACVSGARRIVKSFFKWLTLGRYRKREKEIQNECLTPSLFYLNIRSLQVLLISYNLTFFFFFFFFFLTEFILLGESSTSVVFFLAKIYFISFYYRIINSKKQQHSILTIIIQ